MKDAIARLNFGVMIILCSLSLIVIIGGFAYGYDEIAYAYTFGFIAGALITNLGNNFDGDNQ